MSKQVHVWHSPNIGFDMPVAVYGHYGVPVLFFPTAAADFEEYERFGLIDSIWQWVDNGTIKVITVNGINNHSWFNDDIDGNERGRRQQLYDNYISQEVVPFIHSQCNGLTPIATVGASMGAYHALNTLLKHPNQFKWCIAMSGVYDMGRYVNGGWASDVYFNNPPHYMRNLSDHWQLEEIRSCSINLIVGRGPWEHVDWSEEMARILWDKGVPANLDIWGHDVSHDWPWWKVELNHYIPRLFAH